jgi:DNA polymerase-3 subunit gamma/tau
MQTPAPLSRPAAAPAGGLDAASVRQVWPQIVELTKQRSRMVWALVQNATPREVRGDELVLAVKHQGEARRFADDKVASAVQAAIQTVLGVKWRIKAEADGPSGGGRRGSGGASAPVAAPPPPPPAQSASAPDVGGWPSIAPVGGQGSGEPPAPVQAAQVPVGAPAATVVAEPIRPAPAVPPAPEVPPQPVVPPPSAFSDDVPLPPEPSDPAYDGFDPGDDAAADDDQVVVSNNDQETDAIALLQQHLGARKIGD